MVAINTEPMRTVYRHRGRSRRNHHRHLASDRSRTLNLLASPSSEPHDFVRPGHVLPLRYRPGGVERAGHTEAAVDLARLAGCEPAGVLAGGERRWHYVPLAGPHRIL